MLFQPPPLPFTLPPPFTPSHNHTSTHTPSQSPLSHSLVLPFTSSSHTPSDTHSLTHPFIPQARKTDLSADDVVQEFMQMRALLSYVGDLIMPYHPGEEADNEEGGGTGDVVTKGVDEKNKQGTTKNNLKNDLKNDPKSAKKKPKALTDGGTAGGGWSDTASSGTMGSTAEKPEMVTGGVSKRVGGKVSLALHETGNILCLYCTILYYTILYIVSYANTLLFANIPCLYDTILYTLSCAITPSYANTSFFTLLTQYTLLYTHPSTRPLTPSYPSLPPPPLPPLPPPPLSLTAMQQAVDLWSPLMGSCLPEWSLPHMEVITPTPPYSTIPSPNPQPQLLCWELFIFNIYMGPIYPFCSTPMLTLA